MSLQIERVPLICLADAAKIEEFFNREPIATKYVETMESSEVKKRIEEVFKNLAQQIKVVQEEMGKNKLREYIISKENFIQDIRQNVMYNAISQASEGIIFDGRNPETAVAGIITSDLVLQILDKFEEAILEEVIKAIIAAQGFEDFIIRDVGDLLS